MHQLEHVVVTRRLRRPVAVSFAAVLLPALLLSGCGGGGGSEDAAPSPSSTPAPSPSVNVPAGVTLTDPGTTLHLGDSAAVAYQPNERRETVLRLRVDRIQRGTIKQLSSYVLDRSTRRSTPYYVHVTVSNVGEGDVGHTDVPLWVIDENNTLIHSSSFTNTYRRCPSKALPAKFGPGDRTRACLVYLVPDHGKLTGVSFRPMQAVAPIEWHGTVEPPGGTKGSHGKHKLGTKKS